MKKQKIVSFTVLITILILLILFIVPKSIIATPDNVAVTTISNSTKSFANGSIINNTGGSGSTAGGYIFTVNVNATTQNSKWKAYVGNVSGSLTLDDAGGFTIYNWQLTSIAGELYATRASGTVNWANINCSYTNTTEQENYILNHSGSSDNITATFDALDNKAMTVGTKSIYANTCPTTNLFINDTRDLTDEFEQVMLYDGGPNWFYNRSTHAWNGTDATFGNIIYAEIIETDNGGYHTGYTYDFQILLPERGFDGWASATPYYFYVELS